MERGRGGEARRRRSVVVVARVSSSPSSCPFTSLYPFLTPENLHLRLDWDARFVLSYAPRSFLFSSLVAIMLPVPRYR
jgi:hypothetical protein